jgi:hypothetical protein
MDICPMQGNKVLMSFEPRKSLKVVDIKKYCLNICRSLVPIKKKKLPFPRIENFSNFKNGEISKKQPEESFLTLHKTKI